MFVGWNQWPEKTYSKCMLHWQRGKLSSDVVTRGIAAVKSRTKVTRDESNHAFTIRFLTPFAHATGRIMLMCVSNDLTSGLLTARVIQHATAGVSKIW